MNEPTSESREGEENRDPLTGESGAHPVGTALGAATLGGVGLALAAAVAGPIGVAAAVIGGAIAGGYAGKAAAELLDPTVEDEYWREQHSRQPYADAATDFTHFQPAYRTGYESFAEHGVQGKTFEEVEPHVRANYQAKGGAVPWEKAREASRAAWERAQAIRRQGS